MVNQEIVHINMYKNRIGNEHIQEDLGLTSTGDKLRETDLKRFGHIQCWRTITLVWGRGRNRSHEDKFK